MGCDSATECAKLCGVTLQEFLSGFLDVAAAKLAVTNEPQAADALARLAVELFASQLAKEDDFRADVARMIEPFVQSWLDRRV